MALLNEDINTLQNHAKMNQEDIEREKLRNKQLVDENLEVSLKNKV